MIILPLLYSVTYADQGGVKREGRKVVITSEVFTADNRTSTAVFEGSVVATIEDITIHSDRMTIYYNSSRGSIKRIHAAGRVRVHRNGSVIFSDDATYSGDEEKIVFTGRPKLVEGENVVTGTRIIYLLRDDRAIVEGSRVVLRLEGEKSDALFRNKRD